METAFVTEETECQKSSQQGNGNVLIYVALGRKNHPSFIIISSLLPLVFLEGNKTQDDMDRN